MPALAGGRAADARDSRARAAHISLPFDATLFLPNQLQESAYAANASNTKTPDETCAAAASRVKGIRLNYFCELIDDVPELDDYRSPDWHGPTFLAQTVFAVRIRVQRVRLVRCCSNAAGRPGFCSRRSSLRREHSTKS